MNPSFIAHGGRMLALAGAAYLVVGCGGGDDDASRAQPLRANVPVVIESHGPNAVSVWSKIGFDTSNAPASPAGATPEERVPGVSSIDLTTLHLAMYDAVIAVAGTHQPFAVRPTTATAGASMDAAAIEAAYRVLKGLFPSRGAFYEAAYATEIGKVPDGDAKTRGMAIGAEVAAGMLALRKDDGRETKLPDYVSGTEPGRFQPDPTRPLVGRLLPYIKPFTTNNHALFRAGPPPALDSTLYATDLNEVKAIASTTSTVRTAGQTEVARFFTEPPPPWTWRNLNRFATAREELAENARLMALLYVATADALGACFETKYHYQYWRPTSAIRLADTDGNPATEADAAWTPHVTTPNHPEYPAAHGCNDGATAEVVRGFYGTKKVHFTFDSTVAGTVPHVYDSTDDLVHDSRNARVWGGMHFRNSTIVGTELGKDVAMWVAKNHFRPVD